MIELKHVDKKYKVGKDDFYALKDANVTIQNGEFVAVCGASGSGKSTLLNIIGCTDEFEAGEYLLDGESIGAFSPSRKAQIRNTEIGFVLQDFALIEGQTVLYNVMLPGLIGKGSLKEAKAKALKALECVGLADQAGKKAVQLSGGQKQRVAIARAIMNDPQLILADEPTGQLDTATGESIMELLLKLHAEGKTILMVTHNEGLAERADRVIRIEDGRIASQA